jgi:hypothetical protein
MPMIQMGIGGATATSTSAMATGDTVSTFKLCTVLRVEMPKNKDSALYLICVHPSIVAQSDNHLDSAKLFHEHF